MKTLATICGGSWAPPSKADAQRAQALQPGGIRLDDLLLGVKLACLAYTDDQRGTLESLGGTRKAIEMIAGGPERARRPLSEILQGLGYTVDRIFSHLSLFESVRTVDAHGFIAHNEQDVVISYRGTTGIVEWLTDLAASPTPFQPHLDQERSSCFPAGRQSFPQAHQGFYDAFLASVCDINQKLMPQLRDTSRPKRLIIVGHSIGGAIAMGALGYLLQAFNFAASPHRILFVSIGQPRFGDEVFAAWMDKQVGALRRRGKCCAVRLANDCDAVPTAPSMQGGYRHAAKLCLLTSEGDLLVGPEVEERDGSMAEGVDEHRWSANFVLPRALGKSPRYPDYLDKIKPNQPMDLSSVMSNLDANRYNDLGKFVNDVNMVWANAFKYNSENTRAYQAALRAQKQFSSRMQGLDRDSRRSRRSRTPVRQ
ncbi:Phospholipase A(1) DAD1, chloroplastic [Symbiodinium microadriaticum]|uniref:Phospholipase A(1) DAD1, chloroplastic n=1 Tax=Symbiodinium microadriaticum TaxID=2951 RepID=A0A1Q9D9G2_SYMMI|nr:Phospholipase A(1) DAD1, chloroplastic [Symbiodinium microadriaticum]